MGLPCRAGGAMNRKRRTSDPSQAKRLATTLEKLMAAYACPRDPILFRAAERAARQAKTALGAYYRSTLTEPRARTGGARP